MATQEEIDAALDAALDDLDDDDDDDDIDTRTSPQPSSKQTAAAAAPPTTTPPKSRPVMGPPLPPPNPNPDMMMGMAGIDDMMKQLMQVGGADGDGGGGEAFLGQLLQEMQSQLGEEFQQHEQQKQPQNSRIDGKTSSNSNSSSPTKKESPQKKVSPQKLSPPSPVKSSASSPGNNNNTSSDVDQAIASLVEGMAQQAKLEDPDLQNNHSNNGNAEADLLQQMMSQLGGSDENGGFQADALIDGMMEQLLQKDLMYEPIKKVAEKFPAWLEQHKGKIPDKEYEERCKQYHCFQKLVHMYDSEPNNVQTLMELMQEVQEFGQPPPEIIQDIAPGLEFDADGLPKMDGATGGMPFPGGDEECRVM